MSEVFGAEHSYLKPRPPVQTRNAQIVATGAIVEPVIPCPAIIDFRSVVIINSDDLLLVRAGSNTVDRLRGTSMMLPMLIALSVLTIIDLIDASH